jgi:hypothetical protein
MSVQYCEPTEGSRPFCGHLRECHRTTQKDTNMTIKTEADGELALGNDPDFQALYRSVTSVGAAILRAGSSQTTAEKQALVAALQSKDAARARAALNAVGASGPVIEEQRRLLKRLISRHDLLLDATLPGTMRDASVAARWSYDEEHGGGPAPNPWEELEEELDIPPASDTSDDDESDGNDACYDGCTAQAAALAASALAAYVAALAACTAAGPFWPVCWAGPRPRTSSRSTNWTPSSTAASPTAAADCD